MLMVMAHPALLALSLSRGRQRKGGREGERKDDGYDNETHFRR